MDAHRKPGRRATFALALAALVILSPAGRPGAQPLQPVVVATTLSITDLNLFIARSRGWFREEGLDVTIVSTDSAARMIPALASGEVDVAGGAPSAGLYNAVGRGIGIRIVADKSATPPGRYSQMLVVRKALVESGRVKSVADIKGLRIATAAVGSAAMGTLARLYKMAGIGPGDVERAYLNVPQQIAALQNGAIDAGFPTEPVASEIIRQNIAAKLLTDDQIYPGHQIAVLYYSGQFRERRPEAARAFMRAYLRGARAVNASIVQGRIAGADADEFIGLLAENTPVKDRALLRSLIVSYCSDDGLPNVASLGEDFDIFRSEKLIETPVSVDAALDLSIVREAARELSAKGK